MNPEHFVIPYWIQSFNPHDYKSQWMKCGRSFESREEAYEAWRDLLDTTINRYPYFWRLVNIVTNEVVALGMKTRERDEWGETRIVIHILKDN